MVYLAGVANGAVGKVERLMGLYRSIGSRGKPTEGGQLLVRCCEGLGRRVSGAIDPPELLPDRAMIVDIFK